MFNILIHQSRIWKTYGLLQKKKKKSPDAKVYMQKHILTEAIIIKWTSEKRNLNGKKCSSLLKKIKPESLVQRVLGTSTWALR